MTTPAHAPLAPERKPSVEEINLTLVRIPCACGWAGMWYGKIEGAELSFHRHAYGAASAADFARRQHEATR